MRVPRVTAVIVAAGLLGSPLAALYCNEGNEAAMACCRGDMSKCNQPGKTEDCCRTTPQVGHELGVLPAAKADVQAKVTLLHAALPVYAAVTGDASLTAAIRAHGTASRPEASPPASPVLRI